MIYWLFIVSAVLLAFERIAYYWISRNPERWWHCCERPAIARLGQPTEVVKLLFYGFKLIQLSVFAGWCITLPGGVQNLATGPAWSWVLGIALIAAGQGLNYSVFHQLGDTGIFYGRELGYDVPWVQGFPFSVLRHPQYIGTIMSIWGFFLIAGYPHERWFVIPLLETVYYAIGAYHEP